MTFVAIIIVFVLVQYWGSVDTFHRDGWFDDWSDTTRSWFEGNAGLQLLALVVLPLLLLWLCLGLLDQISGGLYFLASIPLLLFSLGRGNYSEWLAGYCEAYHRNDNEVATEYAQRLGVDANEISDWPELHREVLRKAGYQGLERWFTAIFWFALLGPIGAVFYRLASLAQKAPNQSEELQEFSAQLLWLLEWPVVRLLGLSFALTGNFVSCFHGWKEHLLSRDHSTEDVMEFYTHGALSVNGDGVTLESVTEQEVESLIPLLSRSLILWFCVLALLAIL
ncbi:regulatory signaling modulator protein AmpE [Aestuariicella hydrocarbonica]|uniref:Regulatory signaling modulator protein AmpE n=1 Tax=Pseudomaricurvus hydrocarbonicus TaxID=1470433 RepID=A0A9E5JV39_9GAMM|nr:regulatory signaling modulator protein AmpE [Aestuariicella hydrocarbonica]NHO65115.1 regulatory signaling modulator protein AmpE [Aestuariicella hydrocarbonica]